MKNTQKRHTQVNKTKIGNLDQKRRKNKYA